MQIQAVEHHIKSAEYDYNKPISEAANEFIEDMKHLINSALCGIILAREYYKLIHMLLFMNIGQLYHKKRKEKKMLRLRPFRKNDAKTIITWTSEEKEFYKWSAGILGEYPVSEKRLLQATSGREDNERYFPLTAFDESGTVGFFTARVRPEDDDKKLRFGYVIINPSKRGAGYGKQMLKLGLKFAFEIYGAESVSLGVFENNKQAYHCYKSVGFEENGMREEYNLCGETWIDIEMEINRESYSGEGKI